MPRIDASRNYYADLELQQSATEEEIKKKYKKLALKYHPDRNPKTVEDEMIAKFQVIQQAYEVLSNKDSKKKYDEATYTTRAKYPSASGVRGNPWQDVGRDFPPPPRHPGASAAQNRPTSGAQRYASFANGFPRASKPTSGDDSESRYQAWENMRRSRGRANPPPTPGRAPTSATRDSKTSEPEGVPRTASQREKAKASFGHTRRGGYTPRSPGLGDEPPVSANNYFTNRTHTNIFNNASAGEAQTKPDPLAQFRDKFTDGRQRTPYSTQGGEKTSLFDEGLGRSKSTRESPRKAGDGPENFYPSRPRQRSSTTPRSSSNDGDSEDSIKANAGVGRSLNTNGGPFSRTSDRYKPKNAQASGTSQPTAASTGTNTASSANGHEVKGPSVFNFSAPQDAPENSPSRKRFASSSADNINTRFVQAEHPIDWEFKAGGATDGKSFSPSKMRSKSGTRLGRRSPVRTPARSCPTEPVPPTQATTEETPKAGFSAGEWSEKIGSQHFVPQPSQSTSASPTRRANVRKNSKPVKMTMGTAGIVDDESSAGEGWQGIPRPPSRVASPTAMDIDTPPPEKADDTPKAPQTNGARNIHVEPTRPEWRAGHVDGTTPQAARPSLNTDSAKAPFAKNGAQSTSSPTSANPFSAQNRGSEDSEEFKANFGDFKKVAPFTDSVPTGLHSFADLKSTLPFESRPSEHIPLEKGQVQAGSFNFPTPPVAPRPPPTIKVPGIRPSMVQFRKYAQEFEIYMDKWETFNQKVLEEFSTRQAEYKKYRQQSGVSWLDAVQGRDGASMYMEELKQDQEARNQWMKAGEEHQGRVRDFMLFRDRMK